MKSHHGLYARDLARCYNGDYKATRDREVEQISDSTLSTTLKTGLLTTGKKVAPVRIVGEAFACTKSESPVIVYQLRRGQYESLYFKEDLVFYWK